MLSSSKSRFLCVKGNKDSLSIHEQEMTIKDYYENFKYTVSDSDFSDCEEVFVDETNELETNDAMDTNEAEKSFEFIAPANSEVLYKIKHKNQELNVMKSKSEENFLHKERLKTSRQKQVQRPYDTKVFKPKSTQRLHQEIKKLTNMELEFQCHKCKKIFYHESSLKQHTPENCERHQIFTQRRNKIHKDL